MNRTLSQTVSKVSLLPGYWLVSGYFIYSYMSLFMVRRSYAKVHIISASIVSQHRYRLRFSFIWNDIQLVHSPYLLHKWRLFGLGKIGSLRTLFQSFLSTRFPHFWIWPTIVFLTLSLVLLPSTPLHYGIQLVSNPVTNQLKMFLKKDKS